MKIPAAILSFLLTLVVFYLLGAFVANNFNLSGWTTDGRFMTAIFGFMVACVAGGLTYNEFKGASK